MKEQETIRCDCIGGTHYITFHRFVEFGVSEIHIDFVSDLHRYSFWYNLKQAWRIILGKEPLIDSLIITSAEKKKAISDFFKESKDEED